jgi:L-alanine-DL-glutamate epimerase-like enolase superfamily enzyme
VTITGLTTRRLDVPLSRPWGPDVRSLGVIAVTVADDRGRVGHGFSWTPSIGAGAVQSLLEEDIRAFAIGRTSDPEQLWHPLWLHLHEAGSGMTTIAMAGLDLALWDLSDDDVATRLGRRHERVTAYGSGVNLHYGIDELVAQTRRWVEAGYSAVKVKVGKPDLAEDLDRVAAVREVLGPDRGLMIDANQRWDLATATRAVPALAAHGIRWIEEPLLSDDLAGHVALRERIDTPIALGENLHTLHRFTEYVDAGGCDIVQPNIVRVGGLTPYRRIAAMAEARGVPLAPHLLGELSGQVALALHGEPLVEEVEDAGFAELGILTAPSPLVSLVEDGRRVVRSSPAAIGGIGLRF